MPPTGPKPPALGRPAAGLPRYYMDCGWYRHPKFRGLPIDALFVFEAGVGYCTEHASDGLMAADLEQLSLDLGIKHSTVRKGAQALVDRGVWRIDADTIRIVGWADHNPTKGELDEYRQVKSKQGSYGNHRRWHVERSKPDASCEHCITEGLIASDPVSDRPSDIASDPSLANRMGWDGMGSSSEASRTTIAPPPTNGAGEHSSRSDDDHPPAHLDDLLTATWQRLAHHDLAQHLTDDPDARIRNRHAWLTAAADQRRANHEHDARAHLTGLERLPTPVELAEVLDPSCGPDDGGAARAEQAAAETAVRAEAERARADEQARWVEKAEAALAALSDAERRAAEACAEDAVPADAPLRPRVVHARLLQLVMGEPPTDLAEVG